MTTPFDLGRIAAADKAGERPDGGEPLIAGAGGAASLFLEVREELQDMGNFLDVEAMRRQNDAMVRLTVVTTFGLIGTVTTGFLGMNLIAWADQPVEWRVMAFFAVLIPTLILTLYTVLKSPRLSEFLDALADDRIGFFGKIRAFFGVWFNRG